MPSPSPALVSVDWGTSAFRARLDCSGRRDHRSDGGRDGSNRPRERRPRSVLEAQIGDWMQRFPGLPIVMSGMVGSRQGWIEAPYVACPAGAAEIAAAMTTISARIGRVVIVPGLSARDRRGAPDVMRGEETQILGALPRSGRADGLFVLPGTHSKWARVGGGPHRRVRHLHDRRSLRGAEGPHPARPADGAADKTTPPPPPTRLRAASPRRPRSNGRAICCTRSS